jgi:predicted MFS family arabinose efflux permease
MNNSFSYLGLSLGGVVGALGIRLVDAHRLGFIGAVLIIAAFIAAELASRRINAAHSTKEACAAASA